MNAKPVGMAGMLKTLKIKLEGRHHSGIDDCKNIAKIVLNLMGKQVTMKATGCLENFRFKDLQEEAGYGCIIKYRK